MMLMHLCLNLQKKTGGNIYIRYKRALLSSNRSQQVLTFFLLFPLYAVLCVHTGDL
jgi:hypothetical protein